MMSLQTFLVSDVRAPVAKGIEAARSVGLAVVVAVASRKSSLPPAAAQRKRVSTWVVNKDRDAIQRTFREWRKATGLSPTAFAAAFEVGSKAVLSVEEMKPGTGVASVRKHAERLGLVLTMVPEDEAERVVADTLAAARLRGPALRDDIARRRSAVSTAPGERRDIADIEDALAQLRASGSGHAPLAISRAADISLFALVDKHTSLITPTGRMGTLAAVASALGCSIDVVSADLPRQGFSMRHSPKSLGTPAANRARAAAMLGALSDDLRESRDGIVGSDPDLMRGQAGPTGMEVLPGTRVTTFLGWLRTLGLKMAIRPAGTQIDWTGGETGEGDAGGAPEEPAIGGMPPPAESDARIGDASADGRSDPMDGNPKVEGSQMADTVRGQQPPRFGDGIEGELERLRSRLAEVEAAKAALGEARALVDRKLVAISAYRTAADGVEARGA